MEYVVNLMEDTIELYREELRLRFDEETILALDANSSRHYFSDYCRKAISLESGKQIHDFIE